MKKKLIDVVFMSEKRKNVLLSLQDGPVEIETLLRSLDTTKQALLPQIKLLEDHYLIEYHKNTCELTTIGKMVVDEMVTLLNTVELFDNDIDYWGTHNLDFIPSHLLKRISEIRNCEIINPPITDLYSLHKSFHKNKKTQSVYNVTNLLYPDHNTIFTELLDSNIAINSIISEGLLENIKMDYGEDFKTFIETKLFKLYVSNKVNDFLFFTFDDFHIVISLLKKDGTFNNRYIICSTRDSLDWGKDLFEYYLKDSVPVTDI